MIAAARRPVAYPDQYCWFVLAGALDLTLTWVVLHLGGVEVNPVAHGVLRLGGLWGLVTLKFSAAVVVIVVCEALSQRHHERGRWLATASAVVSFIPPAFALAQIAARTWVMGT